MVILVASEHPETLSRLTERLRAETAHEVLAADTVESMESPALARGELDLLLFSAAFSEGGGKDARNRLREAFPTLRAVRLEESDDTEALCDRVLDWLAGSGDAALGDYRLTSLIRGTPTTEIHRAVQGSMRREVALERLRDGLAADAREAGKFRAMVRARARVTHPAIAAVYESQEWNGVLFYTRELVAGQNLEELAAAGAHLPQTVLLHILETAGAAFAWLDEHKIAHAPPRPADVYLGPDGAARIANTAEPGDPRPADQAPAIRAMAEAVLRLAAGARGATRELSHVLGLMRAKGKHALHSWKSVAREARQALQRLSEGNSSLLPESADTAAGRGRRARRRVVWLLLAAGAAAGVWGAFTWLAWRERARPRDFSAEVAVPAGEFLFRSGEKKSLPAFHIDKYEVSIGQYSAFLDALPHGDPRRFDHPEQPPAKKSHLPPDWAELIRAARRAGRHGGCPVTLNTPVFQVDWWDAWAYAKWKERRLPTEEEWEKAARGPGGRLWPWGMDADPALANTGGGSAPGWAEVDAFPADLSEYGAVGMAGNVAEWTASFVPHPELPDVQLPVFRGGDFHQTRPVPLNAAPWVAKDALYAQPFLGFRTALSDPPPR